MKSPIGQHFWLAAGILFAIVAAITLFVALRAPRETPPCATYECRTQTLDALAHRDGIRAAAAYLDREVGAYPDAGMRHLLLHELGHDAYHLSHDPQKALNVLPAQAYDEKHFFDYYGYSHGVVEAFFADEAGTKPLSELMRESCGQYSASTISSLIPASFETVKVFECFHATGHGTMAIEHNDVLKALADCGTLEIPRLVWACAGGVFMENAMLYLPRYKVYEPKPFVVAHPASFCRTLEEHNRFECAREAGVAYSQMHYPTTDFAAAIEECQLLDGADRTACVATLFLAHAPMLFQNGATEAAAHCRTMGSAYEGQCVRMVATDLKRRNGQAENLQTFCNAADKELRSDCLAANPWYK